MTNIRIIPYSRADNEAALSLERECPQGKSLVLRFQRPTFHARSEVYEKYRMLGLKIQNKLVGVAAWAEKSVTLHGETIRAAYVYDVRVHPSYRKHGSAKMLTQAVLEDIGTDVDCIYTLIAGENERAIGLARRSFGAQTVLPLTYSIFPVFKQHRSESNFRHTKALEAHQMYLAHNGTIEFLPPFNENKLLGHAFSITIGQDRQAGASIWTNENLLAEEVVHLPRYYSVVRVLAALLRPFALLPLIPKPNETIRSWFLFDVYATGVGSFIDLLRGMNNLAFANERRFLYILLQSDDPLLEIIKKAGFRFFTVPYYLLAKGRAIPGPAERVYLDIRDL